jgi:DNA-binding winged-HTH domains
MASARIDLFHEAPLRLGAVAFYPARRELICGEAREILEPRVAQVLTLLARHRGEIVTREEMIAACWENRMVGDDAINRCIGRLRRLSESFGGFELETVPRVGYRLISPGNEDAPLPADPDEDEAFAENSPRRRWRRLALLVLCLVIAVGAGAFFLARSGGKLIVVQAPPRHAIAVLPFSQLSGEGEFKLSGDAVASAVTEALSKTGEPVLSPAESFQFRGAAKAGAAKALNVMYLVDGDVLKDGDMLRVTVRLDNAATGETIFSQSFEEKAARASLLPDRVAAYIAAISWGSDITRWDPSGAPEVLRAFAQQERGDVFAAYETARTAAGLHPDNADVQRLYAWDVINLVYASPAKRKLMYIEEARKAADRTTALAPDNGLARAVLASATPHILWAEREGYLRDALRITPNAVGIFEYLAWVMTDTGRLRDAEPLARSAYERFPYHSDAFRRRAEERLASGNGADAVPVLARALRLWPKNPVLNGLAFEAAAFQSWPDNAFLDDPATAEAVAPATLYLWRRIQAALKTRSPADSAAVAARCAAADGNGEICLMALSALGRLDDAFALAGKLYPDQRAPNRDGLMQVWLANPELPATRPLFVPATAALRADPRFQAITERTGLFAYWRDAHHLPDFCLREKAPVCARIR